MTEDVANRAGPRLAGPEAIAAVLFTGPTVSLKRGDAGLGSDSSESESPGARPPSVADAARRASESRPDPSAVDDRGPAGRPAGGGDGTDPSGPPRQGAGPGRRPSRTHGHRAPPQSIRPARWANGRGGIGRGRVRLPGPGVGWPAGAGACAGLRHSDGGGDGAVSAGDGAGRSSACGGH
jgi:hypothetical protein